MATSNEGGSDQRNCQRIVTAGARVFIREGARVVMGDVVEEAGHQRAAVLGRLAVPEEIFYLVLSLAFVEASHDTGAASIAEGGMLAR